MPIKTRAPKSRTSPGQMVMPGWSGLEPNKKEHVQHELAEQKVLFHWLRQWERKHPDLEWVHSSLNGLPLTPKVMRDATASGMTSGIWDLFIPCQRHGFPGCYIEMKWGKNDLSANQKRFLAHLKKEGYQTVKCYSWIAGVRAIVDYLGIQDEWIEQVLRVNAKQGMPLLPMYGNMINSVATH